MTDPPEPIPIALPEPTPPRGHWLARLARALFVERRIPTRLAETLDQAAATIGRLCRTVVVPDPDGGAEPARLRVRRRSADPFFIQEIFGGRAYSPTGYEIGETDVVIDIGGNIGSFAVFAGRRACRGRVIAVEPAADSFELLTQNLSLNRLDHVQPVRAAVTTSAGPVTLHHSAIGTGHHSLDAALAGSTKRSEQVPGLTLADLFARFDLDRCDLLKLDCEGAEFAILESLPPQLAGRLRRIALEYHVHPDRPKRPQADSLVRRLIDLGFAIDRYEDHVGTNRGMVFARRGEVSFRSFKVDRRT